MKYEWKATSRIFLPLYVAMLVVTIINGFFLRTDNVKEGFLPWMKMITMGVYVAIIIATIVMSVIIMLQRYYKNILGAEGYLMNTLPVKGSQHIISKGIVSTLWIIGSTILIVITIPLIMVIIDPVGVGDVFRQMFREADWETFNQLVGVGNMIGYLIELFFIALLGTFAFCIKTYAAMSLGHLIARYRLLSSIGFYILFDTIEMVLFSICGVLFGTKFVLFMEQLEPTTQQEGLMWLHGILIVVMIYPIIQSIVYFFITKYVLENKLNLE